MSKKIFLLAITFLFLSSMVSHAHAQMMGNYATPSANPTDSQEQQQDETQGKKLFEDLQNKQTTCQKLTNDDFEKIGEYVMSQRFKNTESHVQMNNNIKRMMGENGEEQMHVRIGQSATGCNTNGQGGGTMMGWNYGTGMMGWSGYSGFGVLAIIVHIVVVIDLVLLGIWLWKQIKKR